MMALSPVLRPAWAGAGEGSGKQESSVCERQQDGSVPL